jgi:hypothetical protein
MDTADQSGTTEKTAPALKRLRDNDLRFMGPVELNYRPHAYQAVHTNMNQAQKFLLACLSRTSCSACRAFESILRTSANILRT